MREPKEQIRRVLEVLTPRQKALALTGASMFTMAELAELRLPPLYFLDGGTGANYMQMFLDCFYREHQTDCDAADELIDDASGMADRMLRLMDLTLGRAGDARPEEQEELARMKRGMERYVPDGVLPSCFPAGIVLGAGWDPESVYAMGEALGSEADFYGIDVLLGTPNVNIHRDPLGGRLFEGYSEDPCLTAGLAPALVRGVQSRGVAANVKHFAANNQETDRRTVHEHIPVRALHEIYFPGFRACVQEGGCKTVMSAYNAINGVPCSMNSWLLTDVLRDRWGFSGFVVSDWSAVYDQVEALKAGNDVDMPGPRNVDRITEAVESGALAEAVLDRALTRVWSTVLELPCIRQGHRTRSLDRERSRSAAYACVREGMILLKNRGRTLPLSPRATIGIYGEKSRAMLASGGGSAGVITDQTTNLFDCVTALLGPGQVLDGAAPAGTDAALVTVGAAGQEGFDRKNLSLGEADRRALDTAVADAKASGARVVVILNTCGPVELSDWLEDIDALLCVFVPGMEGGRACADALFGAINPSGKLPITFPKRYRDCPSCGNFPGWNGEVWYGEGIFVGYRHYDFRDVEPLFPFGFGLSYTTFSLERAALSADELPADGAEAVELSVTVRNTGSTYGKEVVQVYVGQDKPAIPKPPKELKRFQKVALEPGEAKTVTFSLLPRDFSSFDTALDDWYAEPGAYHIFVGNSSRALAFALPFRLCGCSRYGFQETSTMGALAATPGALETFYSFCPQGSVTREAIELSILYQASGSLGEYWDRRIKPLLSGTEEEKQRRYRAMLRAVNQYRG